MINTELIERFFKGQCTPEEGRQAADYLHEHPEELEKYLSESAFMSWQEKQDLPPSVSSEWLKHIHKEARRGDGRKGALKWMRAAAAAAVIGAIVAGGFMLLKRNAKSSGESPETRHTLASIPSDERERKENTGGSVLPVLLPDGSLVRLMPKGAVVYRKKFKENRDVYLEGEAGFDVTTDKMHAFTVYSGEISTRVLGTSFRVRALPEDDFIAVRLNTGKVAVAAEIFKRKSFGDVILTPGKELRYNKKSMTVTVTSFNNNVAGVLVKAGNPQYKGIVKPDWYKFSNQPISDVLDQLSNYFGVAIYYYPADIKQINFEGKFEKTDSLEKILTDITLPNNLKFVREDSGIFIKKR